MNNALAYAFTAAGLTLMVSAAPAFADATNSQYWETSTGTRSASGSSYVKGDAVRVTNTQTLKLDGQKGDLHYRGGQLSGAAWFNDGNAKDKTPGFGAALAENETVVEKTWFGSNNSFTEESTFEAGLDTFTIR